MFHPTVNSVIGDLVQDPLLPVLTNVWWVVVPGGDDIQGCVQELDVLRRISPIGWEVWSAVYRTWCVSRGLVGGWERGEPLALQPPSRG